jgi:hypothetical protein
MAQERPKQMDWNVMGNSYKNWNTEMLRLSLGMQTWSNFYVSCLIRVWIRYYLLTRLPRSLAHCLFQCCGLILVQEFQISKWGHLFNHAYLLLKVMLHHKRMARVQVVLSLRQMIESRLVWEIWHTQLLGKAALDILLRTDVTSYKLPQ